MKNIIKRHGIMLCLWALPTTLMAAPVAAPSPHVEPIPSEDTLSTQVAAIKGNFDVGQSGEAGYKIPIFTPLGAGGVTPELALSYSSGSGNGPVGLGWHIEGQSSITRCRQTMEQDGNNLGVSLSASDRFCLDGKKLIAIQGTYGADGTEYRTLVDSQSKIVSYGTSGSGPLYFKVWRSDGSTAEYGHSQDARLYTNQYGTVKQTVVTWAQNHVADNMGNGIDYLYLTDSSTSEQVLNKVKYSPNLEIRFNYTGNRVDKITRYRVGAQVLLNKRLTSIQSIDNGTVVRKLALGYRVSNNHYEVNRVTQSAFGVSLPATTFTWSNQSTGYSQGAEISLPYKYHGGQKADLDGDGREDLIYVVESGGKRYLRSYLSQGSYYTDPCNGSILFDADSDNVDEAWHPLDYNGDGRTDVMVARGGRWLVYLADVAGCLTSQLNTGISTDGAAEQALLLDMNGDGLGDLVRKSGPNSLDVYYLKTTGVAASPYQFDADATTLTLPFVVSEEDYEYGQLTLTTRSADLRNFKVGDFNGDGRADLVTTITEKTYSPADYNNAAYHYDTVVYTLDSGGNFSEFARIGNIIGNHENVQVVDLNSDGLADVLYRDSSAWRFRLNSGIGLLGQNTISGISRSRDIFIADENLDGLADLHYVVGGSYLYVAHGNGAGFDSGVNTGLISDITSDGFVNQFSDVNGDGLADHVFFRDGDAAQRVSLHKGAFQSTPKITKINNGLGSAINISYQALTNPADQTLYSRGSNAGVLNYGRGSPVFDLLAPIYVVSQVTGNVPAYVGGSYQSGYLAKTQYRYSAARIQSGGRGFLGFSGQTTIDPANGFTTTTEYFQSFPYVGMVKSSITKDAAGNLVSKTSNIVKTLTFHGGKVYSPYIATTTVDNYTLDSDGSNPKVATVITRHTYSKGSTDNHANLTRLEVETRDGNGVWQSKIVTRNDYVDSVDHWWLGRLTASTTTHSRPGTTDVDRNTAYEYYPAGHANAGMLEAEIVEPHGDASQYLRTLHCYDSWGNEVGEVTHSSHFSPTGCGNSFDTSSDPYKVYRRKLTEYDSQGRFVVRQKNDKFTLSTVLSRSKLGRPTKLRDVDGKVTEFAFDAFGHRFFTRTNTGDFGLTLQRLKAQAGDIGAPAVAEPYYRVEKHQMAGMPVLYRYFDVNGKEVASATQGFDGRWIEQFNRYDQFGRVTQASNKHFVGDAVHWTSQQYDVLSRPTKVTGPDGTTRTFDYQGLTETSTVSSATNGYSVKRVKTVDKSALGERVAVTDNLSNTLYYGYDAAGKMTSVTGVDGETIVTQYDRLGRKLSVDDPDKGLWHYDYNALGEAIHQTDANGTDTYYFRDSLGRQVSRRVTAGSINETSDFDFGNTARLQSAQISGGPETSYRYDAYGRVDTVTTRIDGKVFEQSHTYDEFGRAFQDFDASGDDRGLLFEYQNGYLWRKREADGSGKVYYQVEDMDAQGNVLAFTNSNGTRTEREYSDTNGLLERIAVSNSSGMLQDDRYTFDGIGNLRLKQRLVLKTSSPYAEDQFGYDGLSRLTFNNGTHIASYENNGNLRWKFDVNNGSGGFYCYGSARPHAVTGIGGAAGCSKTDYRYDANGNMTYGRGRNIDYSGFDKPTRIMTDDGSITDFTYDVARNRIKRADIGPAGLKITYRIGNVEVINSSDNNITEYRRTLGNVMHSILIDGDTGTQAENLRYLHKDHLGSVETISNSNAKVVQMMYYDPWGKQSDVPYDQWAIFPNKYLVACGGMSSPCLVDAANVTSRGFTGHEHILAAGIIHMNGRIYDPVLGRFLQADPHIQAPDNSQSLNRYSYVLNNPLSMTDPSGYFFSFIGKFFKKFFRPLLAIAINIYLPGIGGFFDGGFWATVVSGGISGAVSSGNLQGALTGAFSAGLFNGIGTAFGSGHAWLSTAHLAKTVAHGLAGGLMSVLGGGKFGNGFLSAGVAQLAAPGIDKIGGSPYSDRYYSMASRVERITVAAALGGTASELTGGKFANGAVTGAFSRAFNDEARHGGWREVKRMMRESAQQRLGELSKSSSWKVSFTVEHDIPIAEFSLTEGGIEYVRGKGWSKVDPSATELIGKVNLRTGEITLDAGLTAGWADIARLGISMEVGRSTTEIGASACAASVCMGVSNDMSWLETMVQYINMYIYRETSTDQR